MINRNLRVLEISVGVSLAFWAVMTNGTLDREVFAARQSLIAGLPAVAVPLTDDYDYYPDFEVYYSSSRRQYVYRQGNLWVARAGMPDVPAAELLNSPSVQLDFGDAPAPPHETIDFGTPKNRARLGIGHAGAREPRDEWNDDSRADRKAKSR